jgi:hypothetical protein
MADLHFETLLADCLGQSWKEDVVNFSRLRTIFVNAAFVENMRELPLKECKFQPRAFAGVQG